MKDWVVRPIYLIPAVDIAADEIVLESAPEGLELVRRGVRTEHCLPVKVVRVTLSAGRVLGREAELVKVLADRYDR